MQDLLLIKLFGALRQHYEASNEDNTMINTTLKLLLRCKRLYDGRSEVLGILKTINKRETLREELDFAKSVTI